MITTVLFDLDGTLLPMDQDVFVNAYFKRLAAKLAPRGYDPSTLIDSIWKGTAAMIRNNGSCTNEDAFWNYFTSVYGNDRAEKDKPLFEEFYRVEFQEVAGDCGYTPMARQTIDELRNRGYRVALATNPIFPSIATESRIRWAGLTPEDFELYTTYENSTHCKPNPRYYLDVVQSLGCQPQECLMVGNDVTEDMVARELGMRVFLLTDCLINKEGQDISQYPNGSFSELLASID